MVLQGNVPGGKTVTVGIDSPRSGCFLGPWVKSMWVKQVLGEKSEGAKSVGEKSVGEK